MDKYERAMRLMQEHQIAPTWFNSMIMFNYFGAMRPVRINYEDHPSPLAAFCYGVELAVLSKQESDKEWKGRYAAAD